MINKKLLIAIGIIVIALLGVGIIHIHKPAPSEKTLKEEAKNKLSQIKVAILYQRVTDGIYYLNRSIDDVINILKETKTDFIFRGWWRKHPCPDSPDTQSDFFPPEYIEESTRRGYTYEHLRNAIAKIKNEMPDVIFCGAVSCQWVNRKERDPITGETFDMNQTWAMALDPEKWNISMSKEEFQERFAKGLKWIGPDEKYDHTKVWAYFPDITNPDFQKLIIDLAKKQIDCGADAIWIDYLFNQAHYLAKITKDPYHPAVKESLEAASKIVDEIHNYGYSKGKYIYVGSWASFVDFPYPPPDFDFVTPTLLSTEVYSMEIDEDYWDARIKRIREKLGDIPIFAHMDLGLESLPLTVFAQNLSMIKQRQFLEYADDFFQKKGLIFIYPVHGGWFGKNPKKLAFGKFNIYDSLAPEFQTYETIKELAQKKSKIKTPLATPKRSYIKVVDGNPTLFVGEKPLDILGLRTTSDPYKSDEEYQKVIEYIEKAAKYGYNYVAIKLSWYQMDTTKHNTFPKPEDVGKLMDWKKLDEIFDYAKSKNVYIIPFFWHNVPPQWWFDLTPNYKNFLQTSDKGKTVPMMSFNVPNFQKYEDEAIRAVINRYKNHPAYLGFLLQFGYSNEDNYPGTPYLKGWFDYSPFAKQRFREWLKEKYNHNVSSLQKAWGNSSVNFENAEPPKPLPDITNPTEMIEWINGGGDSRRQFYDWQLFRLEEKRKARNHLIDVVKSADPNHVLIMTSPSAGGGLLFVNSMALDYDEYAFSPRVDIVHINPGIRKKWSIAAKGADYAFVKYFETRGKAAFIKWESRWNLPQDDVEELKKRAIFARETGSGMALWENKIMGFPEFTDKQIKVAAETFHSTPKGRLKKSKFAIIDDTFSKSFDYRDGKGNLKMYLHFKLADRGMLRGLLYSAGLDFDIITTNEILSNPNILKNYRAVALSNLYRMDDELLEILVDYRNSGGGLFIQGRTGLYDKYGEKEMKYLKQLLGINSTIREYKGIHYAWTYSNADEPLLKGISDRQGDKKSKYNVYYIPVFDYKREGYKVLGYLNENPKVATVGYKGKVVFWFPRLGMQIMDLNERELETTRQFLRNLYEFYGVQSEPPEVKAEIICTDRIDNDGDSLIDNEDGDCWIKDGAILGEEYYVATKYSDYIKIIPELKNIGIKTIEMFPIWEYCNSPDPTKRWAVRDFNKLDPQRGTEEELKLFLKTAHKYNIKVITMLSEWASAFPPTPECKYFDSTGDGGALYHYQIENPDKNILIKDKSGRFVCHCCGYGYAPDPTSQDVIDFFLEQYKKMQDYGFDGLRLDASVEFTCKKDEKINTCPYNLKEKPCPEPVEKDYPLQDYYRVLSKLKKPSEIWHAESASVKRVKIPVEKNPLCRFPFYYPDTTNDEYAEISSSHFNMILPYLFRGKINSADFVKLLKKEPIAYNRTRLRGVIKKDIGEVLTKESMNFVVNDPRYYPSVVLVSTIPGVPYVGLYELFGSRMVDKLHGISGDSVATAPKRRAFWKKVLNIRNSNNALKYGTIENVWKSGDNIYAYLRKYENEKVIVVINFLNKAATSILNLSFLQKGAVLYDELNNETLIVDEPSSFKISIPKYGARILTLE